MASTYVPAWQKLGLKLKTQTTNGVEVSDPVSSFDAGSTPRKRKAPAEENDVNGSPSVAKKSKRKSTTNAPIALNGTTESTPSVDRQTSPDSRRKSVTFSADTKAEDGDSSKRLIQEAQKARILRVMAGIDSEDSATEDSHGNGKLSSVNGRAEEGQAQKPNNSKATRELTAKEPKKPSAQASAKVEAARQRQKCERVTRYLEDYKNGGPWKFNKSRQNALLKMVLDVNKIPTAHDEALRRYLEGWQGEVSRQKLRDDAKEVLSKYKDQTNPSDAVKASVIRARLVAEALGLRIAEALVPEHGSDSDAASESERRAIQTAPKPTNGVVNGISNGIEAAKSSATTSNGDAVEKLKKKRKRNRKRRVISHSSSSSSSSSSESDSDSDNSRENL